MFLPALDALQVLHLDLRGARSMTSAVVAFLGLAVVSSKRSAGADAAGLATVRLASGAAVVLHDRMEVGTLALGSG